MKRPKFVDSCVFVLGIVLIASYPSAFGEEETAAITVGGSGEVLATPDVLEIEVRVAGEAELMSDAITKYDGAIRRVTGAVKKLGIEGLTIEQHGIRITYREPGNEQGFVVFNPAGGKPADPNARTGITQSLRFAVPKIAELSDAETITIIAKLLDTAIDAGATIGPRRTNTPYVVPTDDTHFESAGVNFVVADSQPAVEQAHRLAFEDATRRAARLAALADVKLGRVLAVDQSDTNSFVYTTPMAKRDTRLTSSTREGIPVRVSLRVRFALEEQPAHATTKEADQK